MTEESRLKAELRMLEERQQEVTAALNEEQQARIKAAQAGHIIEELSNVYLRAAGVFVPVDARLFLTQKVLLSGWDSERGTRVFAVLTGGEKEALFRLAPGPLKERMYAGGGY